MDVYDSIQSEIVSIMRFDENSDLCTTYLGKVDKSKNDKIKAKESPYFRTGVYYGKTAGWNRMPNIIRYVS